MIFNLYFSGKSKKRSKRSGRKENSGTPEVIDLDDSSKASKDEDVHMVDANGKSGDNSSCESAASGSKSKSKNKKKNKKKSSKKKAKNAQMTYNNDDIDSEADILEEVISEKNGDNTDDGDEDDEELDDEPQVGLAANRSRRSTATTNNKRDSIEAAVSTACKTKENTPAVTDDEASSEVGYIVLLIIVLSRF